MKTPYIAHRFATYCGLLLTILSFSFAQAEESEVDCTFFRTSEGVRIVWTFPVNTRATYVYESDSISGNKRILKEPVTVGATTLAVEDDSVSPYYWFQRQTPQGIVMDGPFVTPLVGIRNLESLPVSFNNSPRYTYGFEFTPRVDGELTSIAALYNGTHLVRIFDLQSGFRLYEGMIASANEWQSTPLADPVRVWGERRYLVAAYFMGDPVVTFGAFAESPFPAELDGLTIHYSTYKEIPPGYTPSSMPNAILPDQVLDQYIVGAVDIEFVPYVGCDHVAPFAKVCHGVNGSEPVDPEGTHYGFNFTPTASGFVTELGGRFAGCQRVSLFDAESATLLASQEVTSNDGRAFEAIQPVLLQKGRPYVVSIYFDTPPNTGTLDFLPSSLERVVLNSAVLGVTEEMPDRDVQGLFGIPDFTFVPLATDPNIPGTGVALRRNGQDGIGMQYDSQVVIDTNLDGSIDEVLALGLGPAPDQLMIGDWNGDGNDDLGARISNQLYLDFDNVPGFERVISLGLGASESQYLTGDWDGNGIDGFGVRRGEVLFLFNDQLVYLPPRQNVNDTPSYALKFADFQTEGLAEVYPEFGIILIEPELDIIVGFARPEGLAPADAYIFGDWDRSFGASFGLVNGFEFTLYEENSVAVQETVELVIE